MISCGELLLSTKYLEDLHSILCLKILITFFEFYLISVQHQKERRNCGTTTTRRAESTDAKEENSRRAGS